MNRLITDFRCACGSLGCCTALAAAALSFGMAAPAEATPASAERAPVPTVCREAELFTGWYTVDFCKDVWQAMREDYRAEGRAPGSMPRTGRKARKPPASPRARVAPPVPAARRKPSKPARTPAGTVAAPAPAAAPRTKAPAAQSLEPAPHDQPLPPATLLGLLGLLIPAAAIGFTVRHRALAAATPAGGVLDLHPGRNVQSEPLGYREAVDPFALPALGLAGPGAADTARFVALTALQATGGSALVVIPRADATLLFGLAEDELLDDTTDRLFIPGSLDAALAYLETELAVRRDMPADAPAPRLLLVAGSEKEAGRIAELLALHPDDLSAVILGTWPYDQATVDGDGLVSAPPTLAGRLPERVPAMSRTEARDRLGTLVSAHQRAKSGRRRRR